MNDVPERIRKIVGKKFGVDAVNLDSAASFVQDLGADSLDALELTMAFEKEFGLDISDDDMESLVTIGDMEQLIEKYVQS